MILNVCANGEGLGMEARERTGCAAHREKLRGRDRATDRMDNIFMG